MQEHPQNLKRRARLALDANNLAGSIAVHHDLCRLPADRLNAPTAVRAESAGFYERPLGMHLRPGHRKGRSRHFKQVAAHWRS